MATSKGKKEVEKQYKKELRRIQQFIRRAEQRGYEFEPDFLPKKPKTITEASVNRLHKITPDKLYAKATYVDSTGAIHKGRVKKSIAEISKTNIKQADDYIPHPRQHKAEYKYRGEYDTKDLIKDVEEARTRREQERAERLTKEVPWERESYLKDLIEEYGIDSDEVKAYVKQHPEQLDYYKVLLDDVEHKHRLEQESTYREQFSQGQLVLDNITRIIDNWRNAGNFDKACDFVQGKINDAIELVGKDVAMRNLSEALDLKENVDRAIYYMATNDDVKAEEALSKVIEAIVQRPMTAEESQHFSALLEDRIAEREKYYQYTGDEFDWE